MTGDVQNNDDPAVLVEGALVAMHLMAAADKYIAAEEVDVIVRIAERTTGETISIATVLDMSEQLAEQASGGAILWQAKFEPYRDLSLAGRETILKSAMMIAVSDGDFHDDERKVLGDLAGWLGLSPDEFVSLLQKVQSEVRGS